jgi:hypothetical protein
MYALPKEIFNAFTSWMRNFILRVRYNGKSSVRSSSDWDNLNAQDITGQ